MGREIQVSNVEVRKIVGFIPSPFDMIIVYWMDTT